MERVAVRNAVRGKAITIVVTLSCHRTPTQEAFSCSSRQKLGPCCPLSPIRGWSSSHNCQWSRLPTKMLLTGRGIPGRGVGCRLGDAGMSPWFRHTHECCALNNARMRCRVFIKTCHHGAGHHQHNANTCLGLARHNEAHTTLRSSAATMDIHYDPTLHNTMDSQHRKLV